MLILRRLTEGFRGRWVVRWYVLAALTSFLESTVANNGINQKADKAYTVIY
jgi:hypothetical protein